MLNLSLSLWTPNARSGTSIVDRPGASARCGACADQDHEAGSNALSSGPHDRASGVPEADEPAVDGNGRSGPEDGAARSGLNFSGLNFSKILTERLWKSIPVRFVKRRRCVANRCPALVKRFALPPHLRLPSPRPAIAPDGPDLGQAPSRLSRLKVSSGRARPAALPSLFVSGVRFGRPVFRRIAEDEASTEDASLHPRVARTMVHLLADTVRLVRTTPAAHSPPLNRRRTARAEVQRRGLLSAAVGRKDSMRFVDLGVLKQVEVLLLTRPPARAGEFHSGRDLSFP